MKKNLIGACVLSIAFASALTGCGSTSTGNNVTKDNIKVGFIFLHDSSSTYDNNFIEAAKATAKNLGLKESQIVLKTGIEEGTPCYEAAADLADNGCNIVFADSFGHESYLIQAAKEFKNVQFCHATGTHAHTEKLSNFHNAFADIYQGRYLTGIAAGMKLNEMITAGTITAEQAVMGYVGAFPYAEVISGFTSFYLGAKSVCPSVTMSVRYTNSWYDVTAEKTTAETLINTDHAVLISQHADSQGAPTACEEKNVPNVFYNGTNDSLSTYLVASRINWVPYFTYMINSVINNETMPSDYVGTLENGAVEIMKLNTTLAAEGTQAALDAAKAKLISGETKVFDTNNFTLNSQKVASYLADVDDDGTFTKETEAVKDGYFHESEFRSAPYFDMIIDGITSILPTDK